MEVASLVLFASDLEESAAFFRAIGVPLEEEDHDEGPTHWATELGPVHFAIYQAEDGLGGRAAELRSASSTFPGFYVDSLDDVVGRLQHRGTSFLETHQVRPWGCRVIVEDPDGRAIEINQRGHCT